jgi:branched-chain amino acid transport system substrate-binding protein
MGSKHFRLVISVMMMLFVAGVIVSSSAAQPAKAKTITIGTIMPVSGPQGAIGLAWDRGWELAATYVNGKGGINIGGQKYTIKLIQEDGKSSPEACSAAANKLVYQDKADVVLGELMENDSQAVYKILMEAKKFHWLSCATNPPPLGPWGAKKEIPYMALMCPGPHVGFPGLFAYVKQAYPKAKRVVTCDNTYAHEPVIEYTKKELGKLGFEVLGVERFDLAATDQYPFATSVLKYKPDYVNIAMCSPDQLGAIIKALREQGFKGPISSANPVAPTYPMTIAGADKAYDIICLSPYAMGDDVPQMMKDVVKAWKAKWTEEFSADSLMAYDEILAVQAIFEKANKSDIISNRDLIVKTLESMTKRGDVKTTSGPGWFGGAKTIGANLWLLRPFTVSLLKDGKIKNVKWIDPVFP